MTLKDRFLKSRTYAIMQRIERTLQDGKPRSFANLRKELRLPKKSLWLALREMVRWHKVVGQINETTLQVTDQKLVPLYWLTNFDPIMHGGGTPKKPTGTYAVESLDGTYRAIYQKVERMGTPYDRRKLVVKKNKDIITPEEFEQIKTFGRDSQTGPIKRSKIRGTV